MWLGAKGTRAVRVIFGIGLLISTAPALSDYDVHFKVYDEHGNELNYKETVARMTNNHGEDMLAAGSVDLKTLEVVEIGNLYADNERLTAWFPDKIGSPTQGLMVYWPTLNTGYSTWLLDNGGKGFTQSATIIFNEQLALDARHQLDEALARRPDYKPSDAFNERLDDIASCFQGLRRADTDSLRGKTSQSCLDLLAQAMTTMLREYGSQRARHLGDAAWWGVTIIPDPEEQFTGSSDQRKIDDLVALFDESHRWVRIAMFGDGNDDFAWIEQMVEYANEKGVKTMGQLFDSRDQEKISRREHRSRVEQALTQTGFDKFTVWEVGNEVNGGWQGPDKRTREKLKSTISELKAKNFYKKRCLTFYFDLVQDEKETSLFNWIAEWVDNDIKDNIDCVTLSTYTDAQPLGFSWELILNRLAAVFPNTPLLVGELAYREQYYFEGGYGLSEAERAIEYIRNRYPAAFATPGSIGGIFWWFYDEDMVGQTPLWHALHDVYCGIYAGANVCKGATQGPGPVAAKSR